MMQHKVVLSTLTASPLCLLLVLCAAALGADLLPEKQVALPSLGKPHASVGDGTYRTHVVSYDLPSHTGGPVLVVAGTREICYFDIWSQEIIRRIAYAPNEWAVISGDGEYIAVVSMRDDEKTDRRFKEVRIENWVGDSLWAMGAAMTGKFEPTPLGGFVAYTSPRPGIMTDPVPTRGIVPKSRPHALLVYDHRGNLILEGVNYDEIRWETRGEISPDGGYLAFEYESVFLEGKCREADISEAKPYLVLYDIENGLKLWQYELPGNSTGPFTLTSDAKRILSFSANEIRQPVLSVKWNMSILDREGNTLLHGQVVEPNRPVPIRHPRLSPDGRLCVTVVDDKHAHLISMEDGTEVWQYVRPPDAASMGCRGVSNDGTVLFAATWRVKESGETRYEKEIYIVGFDGAVLHRFDSDAIRTGGTVYAGGLSGDSSSLWLAQGEHLTLYSIVASPVDQR